MLERVTLTVWKLMIRYERLPVSEDALCRLFRWAKIHGFPVDVETSLDPWAWDSKGFCLLEGLRGGDASVPRLRLIWSLLSEAMRAGPQGKVNPHQ